MAKPGGAEAMQEPPPVVGGVPVAQGVPVGPYGGAGAGMIPAGGAMPSGPPGSGPIDLGAETPDGFAVLAPLTGFTLGLEFDYKEMCRKFKVAEGYKVHAWDPTTNGIDVKRGTLIAAREELSCWWHQFCAAFRPLTTSFQVRHAGSWHQFLDISRPFTCTVLCANRPVFKVTGPDGAPLCEVDSPFACGAYKITIKEPGSTTPTFYFKVHAFKIGEYCPLVCCEYCCGAKPLCADSHRDHGPAPTGFCACTQVTVPIHDAKGALVGRAVRVWQWTDDIALCGDVWRVQLPTHATPRQKAMLMAATMIMDFTVFNCLDEHNSWLGSGDG